MRAVLPNPWASCGVLALLVFAAAAPAASGPVLSPLKPCYVSVSETMREPVEVQAGGFPPFGRVDVMVNGASQTPDGVPADASGTISGRVDAPFQPSGVGRFTLTVAERGNFKDRVSAHARVAALEVRLSPRRARPSSGVRFQGRGFTAPAPVYAHYVFGDRLRRTVELGSSHGACGTFSARARQIPVSRPRTGVWTVQVDQQPQYRPRDAPVYVLLSITVERRPAKPPRARRRGRG